MVMPDAHTSDDATPAPTATDHQDRLTDGDDAGGGGSDGGTSELVTLGTKLPKVKSREFRKIAEARGQTKSSLLHDLVDAFLDDARSEGQGPRDNGE